MIEAKETHSSITKLVETSLIVRQDAGSIPAGSTIERIEMIEILSDIRESIRKHSTIFTVSVIVSILVLGIVFIENRSGFFPTALLVFLGWTLLALMAVGRGILKGIISIFILAFVIVAASFIGTFIAPYSYLGSIWVLSSVGAWATTLSLSYLIHSNSGRWFPISAASIVGLLSTYFCIAYTLNIFISIPVGVLLQVVCFTVLYRFNRRTAFSKSKMPKNGYSEKLHEVIEEACEKNGWLFTTVVNTGFPGNYFIIWDERAYIIYPVELEEQFSFTGRKQNKLAYKDKDISPWISRLHYSTNPSWKTKKADVGLVLLDVKKSNGVKPKMIATSVKGSKKHNLSLILPGDKENQGSVKSFEKTMGSVEETLGKNLLDLTEIQYQALKKVGTYEEDEKPSEIEDTSSSSYVEDGTESDVEERVSEEKPA